MQKNINKVLNFWFEGCCQKDWFKKDKCFDNKKKILAI